MKHRNLVNIALILMAVAVAVIIVSDFLNNRQGKNIENPYAFNVSEYTKVDSSEIIFKEVKDIQLPVNEPKGIEYDNAFYYVIADSSLLKLNDEGQILFQIILDDTPTAITVGERIWLALTNRIVSYDLEGHELARWPDYGPRSYITSLAVSQQSVFVADAGNRIVYECSYDGDLIQRIGEEDEQKDVQGFIIPSPYFDVDLSEEGFLWATDPGRHSLVNFNPDGSLRTSWTKSSVKTEGFSGCCNPSHIAIRDDDSFITSEKGIARVKVYDEHGEYVGVVASPDMFDEYGEPADVCVDENGNVILLDFSRKQIRIFESI